MVTVAETKAKRLIDAGWYQTSRRYRQLARLPTDLTGREALYWAEVKAKRKLDPDHDSAETRDWVMGLDEAAAADQFLRCYAEHTPSLTCTLDRDTFEAFRQLGGCDRQLAETSPRSRRAYGLDKLSPAPTTPPPTPKRRFVRWLDGLSLKLQQYAGTADHHSPPLRAVPNNFEHAADCNDLRCVPGCWNYNPKVN